MYCIVLFCIVIHGHISCTAAVRFLPCLNKGYFTWRTDIFPFLGIFTCCTFFLSKSTYFHQKERVNWLNKLSYKNKYISGLHYFFELPISTFSATLQPGDLIDQIDRERGANRNQSRGIQFIHSKRLTHHPNTRYTLLVMDSCQITLLGLQCSNPFQFR